MNSFRVKECDFKNMRLFGADCTKKWALVLRQAYMLESLKYSATSWKKESISILLFTGNQEGHILQKLYTWYSSHDIITVRHIPIWGFIMNISRPQCIVEAN